MKSTVVAEIGLVTPQGQRIAAAEVDDGVGANLSQTRGRRKIVDAEARERLEIDLVVPAPAMKSVMTSASLGLST